MQYDLPPNLKANLQALVQAGPILAKRIALPVDSDHIEIPGDGTGAVLLHQTLIPFQLTDAEVGAAIGDSADGEDILLFGLGLGELLDALLERCPNSRIVAWDRDPWLLRQALIRRDYSDQIGSGQLVFAMTSDLVDHLPAVGTGRVVYHPIFRQLYPNEADLVEHGLREKRAFVCAGTLFVDDVSEALRANGYSILTWDIHRLSHEELGVMAQDFKPAFAAAINYTHGLSEACHNQNLPLLVWEIDPATDCITPPATPSDRTHIFTYRRAQCAVFEAAGFEHTDYLPLAANPERRKPLELSPEERERYAAPISFVGASMVAQGQLFREELMAAYAVWSEGDPEVGVETCEAALDAILGEQREDFSTYRIPDLARKHLGDFLRTFREAIPDKDPDILIGEMAAADKRIVYVSNLGPAGIQVWGDEAWSFAEQYGVRYRGSAGHRREVTRIYNASQINLDIGRIYQNDMVTMRVFDVLACGGFLLTEYNEALEDLFVIGEELDVYRDLGEMLEKVDHYLSHPEDAARIGRAGLERVLADHTIAQRVATMRAKAGC